MLPSATQCTGIQLCFIGSITSDRSVSHHAGNSCICVLENALYIIINNRLELCSSRSAACGIGGCNGDDGFNLFVTRESDMWLRTLLAYWINLVGPSDFMSGHIPERLAEKNFNTLLIWLLVTYGLLLCVLYIMKNYLFILPKWLRIFVELMMGKRVDLNDTPHELTYDEAKAGIVLVVLAGVIAFLPLSAILSWVIYWVQHLDG